DLKPENIMIVFQDDGTPNGTMLTKILDFGIAQLREGVDFTDAGKVMGTLSYMSPEQIEAKPLDPRCDIYSMGIVFYELITGRVPFRGSTVWQTMSMHIQEIHRPASHLVQMNNPDAVDAVIARCMAKNREQRYCSALELGHDLLSLAAMEQ
ncbi:MAG: serine/threonine protein kinase, partial [Candidatus Saccharimonadales bacterium]